VSGDTPHGAPDGLAGTSGRASDVRTRA